MLYCITVWAPAFCENKSIEWLLYTDHDNESSVVKPTPKKRDALKRRKNQPTGNHTLTNSNLKMRLTKVREKLNESRTWSNDGHQSVASLNQFCQFDNELPLQLPPGHATTTTQNFIERLGQSWIPVCQMVYLFPQRSGVWKIPFGILFSQNCDYPETSLPASALGKEGVNFLETMV